MTEFQDTVAICRAEGKANARAMVRATSHEAASAHFRANSNTDTPEAYGYWDGFLTALVDTKPVGPKFNTELTPEGEQTVIPGCERNLAPGTKQLDLF